MKYLKKNMEKGIIKEGNNNMVTEERLEEIAKKHGYRVRKITRFKHRDRITLEKPNLTITLYLRTKLENIPENELEMYIGKGG